MFINLDHMRTEEFLKYQGTVNHKSPMVIHEKNHMKDNNKMSKESQPPTGSTERRQKIHQIQKCNMRKSNKKAGG
jgi:hypothetical protein